MKIINRVIISILTLVSCSSKDKVLESRTNFIEILVEPKNVTFSCDIDKNKTAFFSVYAVFDNVLYDVFYRSIMDEEICKDTQKEFQKIANRGLPLRIIGIQPDIIKETNSSPKSLNSTLGHYNRTVSAFFKRMWSGDKCISYFENDCDPKDIWGGVIPGENVRF